MNEDNTKITGHYKIIDGTRIYYESCGNGIPFVCIHTAGACSMEFHEFMSIMATKGFRAIAIDLPGHGKSYPVNWQPFRVMHEYAEFVWKIIKAICLDEKPIISGCSIGGNMVTDMACYHSENLRAALAFEGAALTPFYELDAYEEPHACPGWHSIMERAALSSSYQPMAAEKAVELRWLHRYSSQEVAIGDMLCWANHNVLDKMKNVKCPYLVVMGEADIFLAEELLDLTIAEIPNGLGEKAIGKKMGHYPMFEQPEALAQIVMDFLHRKKVILGE